MTIILSLTMVICSRLTMRTIWCLKATPSFVDGGNNVYQLTVIVSDNADPDAADANTREVEIEVAVYETPDYIFNPNPDFNGTVELNICG